ncbi:MAG: protein-glutamate O-methyltransferase CheR [Deltaproteobacteria bacterium]|nr:protein-glutamate O-methyltransferase CheR [Deltaproteobacteria bacterium]
MALANNPSTKNSKFPLGFVAPTRFVITDKEFELFQQLIHRETGITLSPKKKELIVSRLAKRLRALKLDSFSNYYQFLTEDEGGPQEMGQLVNRMTTNKTEFFREAHHFEFLADELLPALAAEKQRTREFRIRAWSAACSTGEEPYTLAITMCEFSADHPSWDIKILATDLDTEVLSHASRGTYSQDRVAPVPKGLRAKYFGKIAGASPPAYQVSPELQEMISFRQFNLHRPTYPFKGKFDFIFCRNVMIYFSMPDKIELLRKLHTILKPGGHIFVGHSESLMMVKDIFKYIKNTIYKKT